MVRPPAAWIQDKERGELPIRPDDTERTRFTHYKGTGGRLGPGPGRRFDARHFAIQERVGAVLILTMLAVLLFWIGVDMRILPDVFGWFSGLPE